MKNKQKISNRIAEAMIAFLFILIVFMVYRSMTYADMHSESNMDNAGWRKPTSTDTIVIEIPSPPPDLPHE